MSIHHIHGGPIWGGDELIAALYRNGWAMVSFARPDQIKKILKVKGAKVVLDNGAFSKWNKSQKLNEVVDWAAYWTKYYQFVLKYYGVIEWFVIPDVIEGCEKDNDRLINSVPSSLKEKAVPVWHTNESLDKLVRLSKEFKMVAIGACGEQAQTRSPVWEKRMSEAFYEIYEKRNLPVKIHGLRMLDGRVMGSYPLHSGDSTNVCINVPKDEMRFPEVKCKLARTAILRAAIEKVTPPSISEWVSKREMQPKYQLDMF